MTNFSFGDVDPEELLQRLTLYAYSLFGSFPDPRFEPVLKAHGASPADLAVETLAKFLDPDDHTVEWKTSAGKVTMDSLLAYLKPVLYHDFIDLKRKHSYKTSIFLHTHCTSDEAANDEMTLDDFIARLESPESRAIRLQQREQLLARFEGEPDLHELLMVQLDPDGFQAYSNIEVAKLLETTVSEIENRKKRLINRLLKLQRGS